ncbi:MAG TPA: glycerophosphodiester phosphodiesterase [Gemmatimonadales bacterium]|nr:glycerophosphodiester phosphodiesterase [Gemmatimonadales bacterium]
MPRPRIIAHRGASGHACENSLAAFRLAVELGADAIELDVHATADGVIVVHHDPVLPGAGPLPALTWDAVRDCRLPNGEPIPLLSAALAAIGDLEVWVEIKSLEPHADRALLATLAGGPAPGAYGVHAFDHRIVARLGRAKPDLRRGVLLSSYLVDPIAPLEATGALALWQEQHLIDADLVDRVHRAGRLVIAWTANEPDDLDRLIRLGVDGLCGNYPERIRERIVKAAATAT